MENPKFKIQRSTDDQFYWNLQAKNGEVILTSERYTTKQSCKTGIESSKRNVDERSFKRLVARNDQYYFVQIANNNEPIGVSEMYESTYSRDNGIAAVKRDAPVAGIEDAT